MDLTIQRLEKDELWPISRCFSVRKPYSRGYNSDEEELYFCIGKVHEHYTEIDADILDTEHTFYFANDIKIERRLFITEQNISILNKIDELVDCDVFIGGSAEGHLPFEVFNALIKKFPKRTELRHYANSRISALLQEYYPTTEKYAIQFQNFIERQNRLLEQGVQASAPDLFKENVKIEYAQFIEIRQKLYQLLSDEEGIPETIWQKQIHSILRLLYPKYIAAIREVVIKGVDIHDKRPDFLLVDANGYVDILEIKKPGIQLLTKQSSYRNNYVPVRDLAGAIQQIEKYIYCLNTWGKDGEANLQKQLREKLPPSITPKVINPQGLLLLGRSIDFNDQQKDDFELIKRQYKHVAEIITYDDLLKRIDNIIAALSLELSHENTNE